MFFDGYYGWGIIIAVYVIVIAVACALLYITVRLAVLHALKAHTRWLETGRS
jgi:hypothetical protein